MKNLLSYKKTTILIICVAFLAYESYGAFSERRTKEQAIATASEKLIDDLKEGMKLQGKIDLLEFEHRSLQGYLCGFKENLQPVNEVLLKIKNKKAIPPDLLPIFKDFKDATLYVKVIENSPFMPEDKLLKEESQTISQYRVLSKRVRLKYLLLSEGKIDASDPYFKTLPEELEELAAPICKLYEVNSLKADISVPKTSTLLDSPPDAELIRISKKVTFDGVCRLTAPALKVDSAISDVKSNQAFESELLSEIKNLISELESASFGFTDPFYWKPKPAEEHWLKDLKSYIIKLERLRYLFWDSPSSSLISSISKSITGIQQLGNLGCQEAERFKN